MAAAEAESALKNAVRVAAGKAEMKHFTNSLGILADPTQLTGLVEPLPQYRDQAVQFLEDMLLIRAAEEGISDLVVAKEAHCPCHLGIGQEAIAVGCSAHLRATDRVFGAHRSHSHYLALGGSIDELMAEVLGKETGASKGMGGSMHLYGPTVGFHGSVPIVAATVSIAVGAALASSFDADGTVAVSYFGDGAAEEGVVHESLNLAAAMQLPILFVCENNLFSSHMDIHLRQPDNRIARFAEAHRIRTRVVDGNDVFAVAAATAELVTDMREGAGPGFLEAVTYRHRGHVGPNVDVDVGVNRNANELRAWLERDPVERLKNGLIASDLLSHDGYSQILEKVRGSVSRAIDRGRQAAYPPVSNLIELVYRG